MNCKRKMLVLCMMLTVGISCWAQSLQLKLDNVTVKKAMTELKQKSGYSFVFEASDVDTAKKISVNAENAKDAIDQILQGQDVTYEIQGKSVIIKRKSATNGTPTQGKKRRVTGTVKDTNGDPVIGATVMEKGTKNGTVTDYNGNFVLETAPDAQLDISYIGFKTQTVKPTASGNMSISLSEDSNLLDDVVVTVPSAKNSLPVPRSTLHQKTSLP